MYLPNSQKLIAAGLALIDLANVGDSVVKGKVLDYAVEKCLDSDGNVRCSKPFPVKEGSCYTLEWSTDGKISHTTIEVRDAGSGEMVYYRDTNGDWKPEKNELVYLDFKPKIWKTGNDTVEYEVKKCDDDGKDL
ncbi:hypothetical protein VFPFJ_04320 [Purpureocillium lilacinum]|uniref:CND01770-like protein n=2 Tax=Purpureocillium lilacinum TaxID=33203 RepID=A0A179HKS3_PURLI|nr:hypothetical protein VFPFJ_04320 [Purpureocillium lilacinum]KAK4095578.1 hypothetical protein Purlil1_374 [Purpureocillium lilacinum]OAQ83380.1 hypothetical protein VFPBJ_02148 [Purpureocillium lilacinum]OAQ90161.1 hypothetical protein VFPFJ_04320 [Purpureocillium lilacinum]PWI65809.1 hypothetical protein PCL_06780 [Purpureocillium lilacinum]GJN67763.1 hypothetical protein PLICBS_001805 [Purpureocillium lilacinum]